MFNKKIAGEWMFEEVFIKNVHLIYRTILLFVNWSLPAGRYLGVEKVKIPHIKKLAHDDVLPNIAQIIYFAIRTNHHKQHI